MSNNGTQEKPIEGWHQLGKFLCCSEKFVKGLVQSGMPVYKVGRKIYGYPSEINSYIKEHPIPKKRSRDATV